LFDCQIQEIKFSVSLSNASTQLDLASRDFFSFFRSSSPLFAAHCRVINSKIFAKAHLHLVFDFIILLADVFVERDEKDSPGAERVSSQGESFSDRSEGFLARRAD
jgi:hypothetical protein